MDGEGEEGTLHAGALTPQPISNPGAPSHVHVADTIPGRPCPWDKVQTLWPPLPLCPMRSAVPRPLGVGPRWWVWNLEGVQVPCRGDTVPGPLCLHATLTSLQSKGVFAHKTQEVRFVEWVSAPVLSKVFAVQKPPQAGGLRAGAPRGCGV